jgi:cysteine-rich repeat protein
MKASSLGSCLFASTLVAVTSLPLPAFAAAVQGTVTFSGNVVFDQPIAGITLDDLTASSGPGIEATGSGEQCAIITNGSAPVDALGVYPESGTLSVTLEISKGGGPQLPEGTCKLQLNASGNDGGTVSARGTTTVVVTLADIQGNAAVAVPDDIVVRQSKTIAAIDKECLKWVKKETKFKGKCNYSLWKLGGTEGSLKCKNAGIEPTIPELCDPANYVDAVVALSFGVMDQQTDPLNADAIDLEVLNDQSKCQRSIGKAAANFFARRNQYVKKICVDDLADDTACRDQATQESKAKLSLIDKCVTNQGTDVMSGLDIADVEEPCRSQCIIAGALDRKCLKDCFALELGALSDNLIGDVPLCGNGVVQAGEGCDDGNGTNGDCCSAACTPENLGNATCGVGACEATAAVCVDGEPNMCTPGTPGVEAGNCADAIDNDCDGLVDVADPDCP